MKKVVISALSALMVTGGSLAAANFNHTEAAPKVTHAQQGSDYVTKAAAKDLTKLPEYTTIASTIDLNAYKGQVMEDNAAKRIIVFKDEKGRQQYKSIFVKRDNRLKVIDFKGGILFNKVIKVTASAKTAHTVAKATKGKKSAAVNLSKYKSVIVVDNYNKRITLYKDVKGHAKYKKILVKKTGLEKLITL